MKIEELTFFRFVAASIVVIFHFGRDATGFSGFLAAGPQMVTFFFVLSGFVMGISYLDKEIDKGAYWWARVARIMPVYLLALSLTVLCVHLQGRQIEDVPLALNLTLLQAWISPYPLAINAPAWSLSVEAFFYLTFPFITLVARYLSAKEMITVSLSIWLITQAITTTALSNGFYGGFPSLSHDLIHYFPLTHFCSFALGVSGAAWIANSKRRIDNEFASLVILGAVSLLIVVLINNQNVMSRYIGLRFAFGSSFFAPLFLIFVLAVATCRTKAIGLLSAWPLVLLGEASYSLYILQSPGYFVYQVYVSRLFGLPPAQNFLVFFLFLTTISIVSFLFFEKPANRFIRHSLPVLARKRLTASGGSDELK